MMKKTLSRGILIVVLLTTLTGLVAVEAQTPTNGQGNSNIIVQNLDCVPTSDPANVVAAYVAPDGTVADSLGASIPPCSAAEFAAADTSIPGNWQGSMVLYSDQEVVSTAMLLWDGGDWADQQSAAAYVGFGEGENTFYLPSIVVDPGVQVGQVIVQNVDPLDDPATVYINYRELGDAAVDVQVVDTIPVDASRLYDLGSPGGTTPDLMSYLTYPATDTNWVGSTIVTSTSEIAVIATNQWRGWSGAYNGIASPDTTLVVPFVARRAYQLPMQYWWAEASILIIQNPNDSAATVDVDFYSLQDGSLTTTFDDMVIPAYDAVRIHMRWGESIPQSWLDPLDWKTGTDIEWVGKAVITSDLAVTSVLNDMRFGQNMIGAGTSSIYNPAGPGSGSGELFMPALYRIGTGTSWTQRSKLYVANLESTDATIDIYFYDRDGNLDLALEDRVVPGDGVGDLLLHYGGSLGTGAELSVLGNNWVGSAHVLADRNVIGTVDTIWEPEARLSTYNALNH
jgi:hypothetical protein